MLAILGAVLFLVTALLLFISAPGLPLVLGLLSVGLGLVALHIAYPWTPWRRTA